MFCKFGFPDASFLSRQFPREYLSIPHPRKWHLKQNNGEGIFWNGGSAGWQQALDFWCLAGRGSHKSSRETGLRTLRWFNVVERWRNMRMYEKLWKCNTGKLVRYGWNMTWSLWIWGFQNLAATSKVRSGRRISMEIPQKSWEIFASLPCITFLSPKLFGNNSIRCPSFGMDRKWQQWLQMVEMYRNRVGVGFQIFRVWVKYVTTYSTYKRSLCLSFWCLCLGRPNAQLQVWMMCKHGCHFEGTCRSLKGLEV